MKDQSTRKISRRSVIAGVGGAAGAAMVSQTIGAPAAGQRWDQETDILCVGGGATGCAAAVVAADGGAKVTLMERAPILGGTSRKSGGVAWVPNHSLLRAQGIEDRKEDCLRYMARFAYPHRYASSSETLGLDPLSYKLLEAFYDNGSNVIDRLSKTGAVEFGVFTIGDKPPPDYADHLPENKVPTGRALAPKDASGATMAGLVGHGGRIIDACEAWLTKRGVPILTEHRATRIVMENGRCVGVEATTGGKTVRIRTRKGVIFATGGFAHNTDLIQMHQRFLYGSCAVAQSQGDFVQLAGAVGARMGQMDMAWRTQVVLEDALQNRFMAVGVFFVPSDSMIIVNKHGRRAVDEKRDYNDRTRVHFTYDPVAEEFPNQILFMIIDERARDAFGGAYPIPVDPKTPYLISGNTLEELSVNVKARLRGIADKIGGAELAPNFSATLAETVRKFNEYARAGHDPEFSRGAQSYDRVWQGYFSKMREGSKQPSNNMPNPTMYPIADHGPYYAIILGPGALDTSSGPMTNERAQILDSTSSPIPGLYGAGNCICAPTRDAYMGAGGTLGPNMAFAYIAAMHAIGQGSA
jgi:3-oxosteroid 1-dehydrogenase